MECEHCKLVVKTKYNLKSHLSNNKACLKLRGLEVVLKFICRGCSSSFNGNTNLNMHQESCKLYQRILIDEEYKKIISDLQTNHKIEMESKDRIITDLQTNHKIEIDSKERIISDLHTIHMVELESKDKIISDLKTNHKVEIDSKEKYIKDIQTHYTETNEKTIKDLFSSIEKLASKAIDKTQTNITTNNSNVGNVYSDKYTLDSIQEDFVERKFQNHLTEEIFMEGQRGIARICSEQIVHTPDEKILMRCTDASRRKFKHMDKYGNFKEDYDARAFIEKVFPPIKKATDLVYNTIMGDIQYEKKNIDEDDYRRKSELQDKSLKVIDCYAKIICIDNHNLNSEFKNELAILTK